MKKTLNKNNIVTFCIRQKYKRLWPKFIEVANKDPFFTKNRYRHHTVTGYALVCLINNYLISKGINTKELIENETSDKNTD